MVYRILMLVEMLVMLKRMTNLCNLMEAIDFLSKTNSFQEWIFGQANWACLSHRSLEGGTRVQQIIIGYFVAPISLTNNLSKGLRTDPSKMDGCTWSNWWMSKRYKILKHIVRGKFLIEIWCE